MNRHKFSWHFFPRSARTIVAFSALSIGLLSLSCPCHTAVAQTSTRAIAQEFPNQNFPENLPGRDLARHFPKDWKAYASSSGHSRPDILLKFYAHVLDASADAAAFTLSQGLGARSASLEGAYRAAS